MNDVAAKRPAPVTVHAEAEKMLVEALRRLQSGESTSVAVIMDPAFCGATGPNLTALYIGCDILKARMRDAMTQPPSAIIRVRGGGG